MTRTNDGGPAFPMITDFCPLKGIRADGGMSLRDYFAGQTLSAMINSNAAQEEMARAIKKHYAERPHENQRKIIHEVFAKRAYMQADAMLAERERHKTTSPVSDTESELAQRDHEL